MEAKTTYWIEVEVKHAGPLDFNELAVVLENQLNGTHFEFVRVTGATCNPNAVRPALLHTYNPATEVKISRKAAKYAADRFTECGCSECVPHTDEFRAALEGRL